MSVKLQSPLRARLKIEPVLLARFEIVIDDLDDLGRPNAMINEDERRGVGDAAQDRARRDEVNLGLRLAGIRRDSRRKSPYGKSSSAVIKRFIRKGEPAPHSSINSRPLGV